VRESMRHGAPWQREKSREPLWGEAFVRSRDAEEHRVARNGIDVLDQVERAPDDSGQTSRFRLLDQGEQRPGRIVLIGEDETVHPLSSGIEEVVHAIDGRGDVGDERQSWQSLLEVANAIEVRASAGEEIDDRDAHRLTLAQPNEILPLVTGHDLVSVADGEPKALQVAGVRKNGRDDAHTCCESVRKEAPRA